MNDLLTQSRADSGEQRLSRIERLLQMVDPITGELINARDSETRRVALDLLRNREPRPRKRLLRLRKPATAAKGFTLVELMVAGVILSVLTTMSLGSIRPTIEHQRKDGAGQVLDAMGSRCLKAMLAEDPMLEPNVADYGVQQVAFEKSEPCWSAMGDVVLKGTPSPKNTVWTDPVIATVRFRQGVIDKSELIQ